MSFEEVQEGIKNAVDNDNNVPLALQGANSSSSDLSIPLDFETFNRFQGLVEEQEVASAPLVLEVAEISIAKPASSQPILGAILNPSQKSKVTGLFPNGTLSTQRNSCFKSLSDPNKFLQST